RHSYVLHAIVSSILTIIAIWMSNFMVAFSGAMITSATRRLLMATSTDRIEKKIMIRAPRPRIWRALTDSKEFGTWFGMRLDAPFEPGKKLGGTIVPTTVDPEVAKHQKPYEGVRFDLVIDRIEPERLFS